jgi:outer membrane protein assembly factor BamB
MAGFFINYEATNPDKNKLCELSEYALLIRNMRTIKFIQPPRPTCTVFLGYIASFLLMLFTVQATASPSIASNPINCTFSPYLSCVDSQSGEALWHNLRYSDPDNFSTGQDRLYISHSTTSSSYDIRSGAQIWQVSSESNALYFYPVLAGKNVYLARSDGILEKRWADSGKIIWSRSLADGWVYPPLILQNHIITGGQNRIIWVLDDRTGMTRDSITLDQELVAPLFQVNERFISSTFDGQLRAFRVDQQSGRAEPVWQTHLDAPAFSYVSDSEHFVAADMGGKLNSLDPETGQLRWRKTVHQNALYWNTLYRKSLISLTESGTLTILELGSGELKKKMQFDRQYIQAPIVQGDTIALYDITGAVQHLTNDVLSGDIEQGLRLYSLLTSTQRGTIQ